MGLTKRVVTKSYTLVAEVDRQSVAAKVWATRRANGTDRHSEATREKLRLAAAQQIAASNGRQVSEVENKVAEILAGIGVMFERQKPIRDPATGRFCGLPDFSLADGSVLEVNGTFWHADPRFYPDGPIYPCQRRTLQRYAKKVASLNRLGILVHEVWEADISEDAINAVRVALAT